MAGSVSLIPVPENETRAEEHGPTRHAVEISQNWPRLIGFIALNCTEAAFNYETPRRVVFELYYFASSFASSCLPPRLVTLPREIYSPPFDVQLIN